MLLLSYLSSFVSPLLPLGLGFFLPRGYFRRLSCYSAGLLCMPYGFAWYYSYTRYDATGTRFSRLRLLSPPEVCMRPLTPPGGRGEMAMSPPRWLCCGLAACCAALVVFSGCRLSEHTRQGPGVCRDAQANLVQPSLSSDSLRLCTPKCTGPG